MGTWCPYLYLEIVRSLYHLGTPSLHLFIAFNYLDSSSLFFPLLFHRFNRWWLLDGVVYSIDDDCLIVFRECLHAGYLNFVPFLHLVNRYNIVDFGYLIYISVFRGSWNSVLWGLHQWTCLEHLRCIDWTLPTSCSRLVGLVPNLCEIHSRTCIRFGTAYKHVRSLRALNWCYNCYFWIITISIYNIMNNFKVYHSLNLTAADTNW